ncbi:MAG: electron transfer flavoprotein subunit alpha/FixB family protein [Treponema sp.]|jgi:electron transfer flavoprotein alpha subunit|nr:electron transfer flavoprotein subunit alpha/FixB family protein [Treponema sp.]
MLITNDSDKQGFSNVWVMAEVAEGGDVHPVTHELLGAARKLAALRKSKVGAVIFGANVKKLAASLIPYGADIVIAVEDPRLALFNDELEGRLLNRLITRYKPEIILCGATTRGRALAPRVAVMAVCGLTADCTGLDIDPENGDLLQTRPAFGGNIMATIRCSKHRPQMATVRPRVMKAPAPDASRTGQIIFEDVASDDAAKIKRILEYIRNTEATVNLADASIIVSGGRAMKGSDGFKVIEKLAAKIGAAVGASRAAVDAGWISYAHQVGQTGQTVQTKLYIACGISGQIQHLVGMQSCETIIAIDKNADTPMMQMADIAVTGDLFEIVPALTELVGK